MARLRSKDGCIPCKFRRKKCPEQKPVCSTCLRLGLNCSYPGSSISNSFSNQAIVLGVYQLPTMLSTALCHDYPVRGLLNAPTLDASQIMHNSFAHTALDATNAQACLHNEAVIDSSEYESLTGDSQSRTSADIIVDLTKLFDSSTELLAFAAGSSTLSSALTKDEMRRNALEFAFCYIQRSIVVTNDVCEFDVQHEFRRRGRILLQSMLIHPNVYLPSTLTFITTVLHLRGSFVTCFVVLHDCQIVLNGTPECSSSQLATYITCLCKTSGSDHELMEATISHQNILRSWAQQSLASADLRINLDCLIQTFGRDSSPVILVRYQYARFLLYDGHESMALSLLAQTVHLSELVNGYDHFTTIHGLLTIVRAFKQVNRHDTAVKVCEDCVQRLVGKPGIMADLKANAQRCLRMLYETNT